MQANRLILKRCRMLQDGAECIKDVVITGKIITDITDRVADTLQGEVIDVNAKHVLPGIIDPHVHYREPGLSYKEDFLSGTMAAAAGGITTILDMPNTIPPTITTKLLEEKRRLAQKCVVNYGFHFGTTGDNIEEIQQARNIASVKVYMNETTGKLLVEDRAALERIFSSAKRITVHAEGRTMEQAIELALKHNCQLYIAHVSTQYEIELIRKYKSRGKIFAEATPHHMFLSEEDKGKTLLAQMLEVKPSLKSKKDKEAIFAAVHEGIIDCIGTDHAPHTKAEKLAGVVYGLPGVETMLPLLLHQVHEGRLQISDIQRLCCENPAKIFGIKNKGCIRKGYDADLTIVDCTKDTIAETKYSKSKWSPFTGRKLRGMPVMTIVNGRVVFESGAFTIDSEQAKDDKRIYKLQGREVEFDV